VTYIQIGARYIQASYTPDITPDGTVRGYLAAVVDMTERRRAEVALLRTEEHAEALLEDYGATLDNTAKDYLNRIRRSSERMENLTHDVLAYSRVARGEVELRELDLESILRELIDQYGELQAAAADLVIEGPLPRVRLWIADNGIGIPPEYHASVFQVFERAPTKNNYDGTGIGLAIVGKTAEKMGGRCGVESDGRTGSRFWIELVSVI
jgi:signal transduction histidine kinase